MSLISLTIPLLCLASLQTFASSSIPTPRLSASGVPPDSVEAHCTFDATFVGERVDGSHVLWLFDRTGKTSQHRRGQCPSNSRVEVSIPPAEASPQANNGIVYPDFVHVPPVGTKLRLRLRKYDTRWIPLNWQDGVVPIE